MKIDVAEINRLFAELRKRVNDVSPVTPIIAVIIQKSIAQNFRSGGRTDGSGSGKFDSGGSVKWKALAAETNRERGRRGRSAANPLQDTRQLASSIIVRASGNGINISSNKAYAALQQFGGTITPTIPITPKVRKYFWARWYESKDDKWKGLALTKKTSLTPTIKVPARPYIVMQSEDTERIKGVIAKHITK